MPPCSFAPPGIRNPTTRPPCILAAEAKTLNSTSFITSVSSVNSSFTRMSGLSEPYKCIAVAKSMTGNGSGKSTFNAFLKTIRIMPSNKSRISCSDMKEVSQSI